MKLTEHEKDNLIKIQSLFEQIDTLWGELSETTKYNIFDYHNEGFNLPHCIKWGLQAVEEILED